MMLPEGTLHRWMQLKAFYQWTWDDAADHYGVGRRHLRYVLQGVRQSLTLEAKITHDLNREGI